MIQLLIADDNDMVRFGLERCLAVEPDMVVLGAAPDGAAAVEMSLALVPDVVLMDISMPVMDGIEATRTILARQPSVRVLVLTFSADHSHVRAAFAAGATGYLLKDSNPEALASCVRAVVTGGAPMAREARAALGMPLS